MNLFGFLSNFACFGSRQRKRSLGVVTSAKGVKRRWCGAENVKRSGFVNLALKDGNAFRTLANLIMSLFFD